MDRKMARFSCVKRRVDYTHCGGQDHSAEQHQMSHAVQLVCGSTLPEHCQIVSKNSARYSIGVKADDCLRRRVPLSVSRFVWTQQPEQAV